ncbi:hypothetical protein QYF36_004205 [Acer negundo]|nr:hypothetical protein QYF36_004205 [Acer negundo]
MSDIIGDVTTSFCSSGAYGGARSEVLLNHNGFRVYSPNSLSSSSSTIIQGYGSPTDDQEQNPPPKKKRNRLRNPDPSVEVIALLPRFVMLKPPNRFKCEVRSRSEMIRKKVYVCSEPTCINHNPARALRDLTGMKKHFYRKYCDEKIWQCDKCHKKYVVESDCKAHSNICGVKNFKCKCGSYLCRRILGIDYTKLNIGLAILEKWEKDCKILPLGCINDCTIDELGDVLHQIILDSNNEIQGLAFGDPLRGRQEQPPDVLDFNDVPSICGGSRAEVLLNQHNHFRVYSQNSLSSPSTIIQGYRSSTQKHNPPPKKKRKQTRNPGDEPILLRGVPPRVLDGLESAAPQAITQPAMEAESEAE